LTPALATGLLEFAKGSDPPLKAEMESTDDFQTRSIDWMKKELRSLRLLCWLILLMQANAQWLHLGIA